MQLSRRQFLASTAAVAALPLTAQAAPAFSALMSDMAETILRQYPETASSVGVDTGARLGLKAKLAPRTLAHRAEVADAARQRLAVWTGIDPQPLSPADRISLACMREVDRQMVEGAAFAYGDVSVLDTGNAWASTPYAVTQMTGAFQTTPAFLDTDHPVKSAYDAEAWLARLDQFAANLDAESERVAQDASRGVSPPDVLLRNAIGQLKRYRAQPVADWGLISNFGKQADPFGARYRGEALAVGADKVGPALDRQIAALEAALKTATSDAGAWKLPDGEAYYRWRVGVATTTTRTPEDLHALGLEQMAALEAEMDQGLRRLGYSQGTAGERMAALGRDPAQLYSNDDKGRAELLAYLNGRITAVRAKLPQAFATSTPALMEIRRVPPAIQDGAPNGYAGPGPIDGSRPGIYYINLKDTANWPRFSLSSLTFHEGIPGHIWQGDYTHKQPLLRSLLGFNAFTEGWALYAEQMGDELGLYEEDPLGRLGYLQSIQFRACRLVVDTGLHAKRWDMEKAVQFLTSHTGQPEPRMRSEVQRYCATPGQACGYKVGHNEINRQRQRAIKALGAKFDLRRFNDAVVTGGNVPLVALEGVISDYIKALS
jgi:uncharacterized protein (DUF885 family)